MNGIKAFLCAAALAFVSTASGADWPRYFDTTAKVTYILVVLHEDGDAEFLHREVVRGEVYLLHDPAGKWGYFTGELSKGPNNSEGIWVGTQQFRFDYYLEANRLIEHDKMGIQHILGRRKNTNPKTK